MLVVHGHVAATQKKKKQEKNKGVHIQERRARSPPPIGSHSFSCSLPSSSSRSFFLSLFHSFSTGKESVAATRKDCRQRRSGRRPPAFLAPSTNWSWNRTPLNATSGTEKLLARSAGCCCCCCCCRTTRHCSPEDEEKRFQKLTDDSGI
jgi:hypothetical protein